MSVLLLLMVLVVLLVGAMLLWVLLLVGVSPGAFLRAGGAGTLLGTAVLPSALLLSPGEVRVSPTETAVSISAVAVDLGEGFFLLDLLLVLLLDLKALAALIVVSIVSVQECDGAQWNVLAAPAVSDLLSVKVSAHTDGLVAVGVINEDDDLAAIESDVVLGGQDLDTPTWMWLNSSNEIVGLLSLTLLADGVWEGHRLSVY